MAICLPVVQEQIRAEVLLGSQVIARTPNVKSFNVSKSREQTSTTFSVQLEILGGTQFQIGQMLTIRAGTRANIRDIFTGKIEGISSRPVFGKPSYYALSLSGRGVLSELENKTFSRRLRTDGQGLFCLITGARLTRPVKAYSLDKSIRAGNSVTISLSPNPASGSTGENSPLIINNSKNPSLQSGGSLEALSTPLGPGKAGGGGSFRQHTHETLDEGGPAFAVYSAD